MDKIISLSAFGDVIDDKSKPAAEVPVSNSTDDVKQTPGCSIVLSKILQNTAQTKLLHWQSKMYGQHKALDELYGGLSDLGDTLAETIMGKYGVPALSKEELCLKLMNFRSPETGDLNEFMDHLYNCYHSECRSSFDPARDSEIINILDEILSLVNKTKYLLSLR
jgi:DNA-binding ferritin-like protein